MRLYECKVVPYVQLGHLVLMSTPDVLQALGG